jgi:hypothetical protein
MLGRIPFGCVKYVSALTQEGVALFRKGLLIWTAISVVALSCRASGPTSKRRAPV